ncbi:alkyl hydroperoxide reductase/ Thiol specific antioxidant/ Mal allergen [Spirochaeta thermophila DSM 6578]|uniref:Alkyl hydroperoxide reductase/ Thiol specific antioxidant/ Mal allergen n=1 Tax=Winmispira thermophila (strain ATCC 700085 / DSM 6578 / Z-1203) TaxID=869211 RepID=G0GFG2_WINT7|nr:TlpA disulfide reductase family protein [Spirochaeta thermophila]AEJ61576.1 alkyl hydroperoxide reductase/ Thiol specific antioxidant/ Mal allergen [Spirochaeta thermophila DSM 6578]
MRWWAMVLVLSLATMGCSEQQSESQKQATGVGQKALERVSVSMEESLEGYLARAGFSTPSTPVPAPEFMLPLLEGGQVSLSDYRGKVVLLNFWATWCPPCRMEMPSIETMVRALKGEDVVFLAVDVQEQRSQVSSFIKENGYTFPVLLDATGQVARMYAVSGIPTTYFIDKEGNVRGKLVGARNWDAQVVYEAIKRVLAE